MLAGCLFAAQAGAQPILAQQWDFNDPAGTALTAVANGVPLGSQWTAGIANTATTGSGALRIGYNSTSVASSYAPLNIAEGGVYAATIVFQGWDIRNGAASGSTRPILNFGFRSAASTSSSLVADVQFTATTTGVTLLARDAQTDFTANAVSLPLALPGPLTVTLKLDKTASPATYTVSYAVAGGVSGTVTGPLGATAVSRTVSHVNLAASGNFPGTNNVAPLVDSISVAYGELPVTILPPANGRPGKPSNLVTFLSGNPVQANKAPVGGPALLLMGGGAEVDAAFTARAYPIVNGGDIVVLRAAGGNGYQSYLYSDLVAQLPPELQAGLQPNSVETLIVDSRAKANSDYVADAVAKANLVWMAGGDQSQYLDFWRGTALAQAVRSAYKRGAVVGGTSAGMVVTGEWMYDPGANLAVTSAEAVANPYRASVVLNNTDLFGLAQGFNLIPEPHFANRDRMGRLLTFMARLRQDARSSLIFGVGLDEGTSLFINANNVGSFQRQTGTTGSGYILAEDRRATQRVQVSPGLPLVYRKVQRVKLAPGGSYDFARGLATQPGSVIDVEGVVPANPY
ncbi:cyanophycinase [Roseateles sp.]|uniref:cyanophycinase n=1 Tax=Roseateles sp. TaxID=1971397 RepID=UPI003BADAAA7